MLENEQINLWRGDFGTEYNARNAATEERVRNRTRFWSQALDSIRKRYGDSKSILEVGANVGINLRALRNLCDADLVAVEPNDQARENLVSDGVVPAEKTFAATGESLPFPDNSFDLVFTSGVLVHVSPDNLAQVCSEMHRVSRRVVMCAESFSSYPETIVYRGHTDKLFKRDFGAFWMEQFPSLKLIDYGFAWKPVTGLDNVTWWIFSKPEE
ncbi:pseudaminic acid biosynthesis-associated methylase [Pelagibius sp. Alg239-R121]|uniref:pseudaminic acid biosynthesis-associated methylase n=1 Tax=Pelagibius sp. Alg239-R121 TaxID=2993448 RepID=UPI0024A65347|nr:pseudaminic acid biosynthesis-associated methylase [Pelagibius sp. Alg239-R121]